MHVTSIYSYICNKPGTRPVKAGGIQGRKLFIIDLVNSNAQARLMLKFQIKDAAFNLFF